MSRYTGWRRLSGDTADRPDLLDYGKKLLGELENQRRLSGVKTCAVQKTLPDGSIVQARFDYDLPSIHVLAAKPSGKAGNTTFLSGLVAQPRTIASYTAFGANAETVLVPFRVGSDTEHWDSYFFDATYVPAEGGGIYSKTPDGKPLFADGLVYGGNLDWRSTDENLTVNWFGPASRYFPEHLQYAPWVFRNGDVLFDANDLPLPATIRQVGVLSAAIRKDGPYLLVAVYEKEDDALEHYVRFYRLPIKASSTADAWFKSLGMSSVYAPRLEKTDAATAERVAEIQIPQWNNYLDIVPFHFNQSATEARAIVPLSLSGTAPAQSDVTEFIVDLRDWDNVVVSTVSHGVSADVTTTTETYADVAYNRVWGLNFAWRQTPPGWPGTGVDGTYPYDDPVKYGSTPPFAPSNPSTLGVGVPQVSSVVLTESCSLDEYPIAVDFKDDVPVYAYMTPRDLTTTCSRNGSVDWTTSGSGSATDVATSGGRILTTSWSCSKDEAANASATVSGAITGTMPGLRCPGDDGDWLSFQGSQVGSSSKSTSSTYSASGSDSGTRVQDGIAGTDTGPPPPNDLDLTGTVTYDETSTYDNTTVVYKLWYLDLRYQAAAYTRFTRVRSISRTASLADVWPLTATGVPTSVTDAQTHHFSSHVVFNGAEVGAWDCDTPTVTTTNVSDLLFGAVNAPFWIWCGVDSVFSRDYSDTDVLVWSVGDPTSSALTAEGNFEATLPTSTDWSGSITPAQVAAFALPQSAAYPDVVVTSTAVVDDGWFNLWFDGDDSIATAAGASWLTDTRLPYGGLYQAYRKGWLYCMPKLVGTSASSPAYEVSISSGESVDTLTGSHGLETLGALWPLSRCPFITPKD